MTLGSESLCPHEENGIRVPDLASLLTADFADAYRVHGVHGAACNAESFDYNLSYQILCHTICLGTNIQTYLSCAWDCQHYEGRCVDGY